MTPQCTIKIQVCNMGMSHFKNCGNNITIVTDAVAFSGAHFGAGTGTIFLDDLGCSGSEQRLTDCSRSSTVSCFSGHNEDAGVRCQGVPL